MSQASDQPTLLVADDDPDCLHLLYRVLDEAGFEVTVANDGEMVLEAMRRQLPDLVLLDAMMPGLDGFETCRRLKANPATREVPVIFATAHNDAHYRLQTFQVGAVDFISKPFEEGELLARVRTHLSLRRLTRTLQDQNARLREEIDQRAAAQAEREQLMQELREAKDRLERELLERERAQAAHFALQEQVIAAQQARLAELSTPLIPITDRVMVMPLIGAMDTERAQQVMETALRGVASHRADLVILDVTGVQTADASTASMLARTSRGLELLGARTVVTGLNPAMARTLISIGAPLGSLMIKATLQEGIAYAFSAARVRPPALAGGTRGAP